jgi:hypothetical protein
MHSVLDMHVHVMHFPPMRLSDWMAARGLDDEGMAALVQADRSVISRIRRGLNRPSWPLAARFKAVTEGEVTADDFLPDDIEARA